MYASEIIVHEHNLQAGRKQISSFKYQAVALSIILAKTNLPSSK
jgi:hypothetical protein